MQRAQRATAGNIYKKRKEEIQLELSQSRPKRKTPKKSNSPVAAPKKSKFSGSRSAKKLRRPSNAGSTTSRTSRSSRVATRQAITEEVDNYELGNSKHDEESDDDNNSKSDSVNLRVSRLSTSSRSSTSSKKTLTKRNLTNEFKCPYCPATFTEERYVDFHCQQKHKKEEKPLPKTKQKTVQELKKVKDQSQLIPPKTNSQQYRSIFSDEMLQEDPQSDMEDSPQNIADDFSLFEPAFTEHFLDLDFLEEDFVEFFMKIIQEDGEVFYKCTKCSDFVAASKQSLMSHIQRHGAVNTNHRCPYCPFRAKNRTILETHMYSHTGVMPFCCRFCDVSFKCTDELLAHSPACESQNKGQSSSRLGRRTVSVVLQPIDQPTSISGERGQHKCPFCKEKFLSKFNLERHIDIHRLRGITSDEREEEKRTLAGTYSSEETEDTESDRQLPANGKRKNDSLVSSPLRVKRKKDASVNSKRGSMVASSLPVPTVDTPPSCPVCNKVFLYTIQIEKHMKDVHKVEAEVLKSSDNKEVTVSPTNPSDQSDSNFPCTSSSPLESQTKNAPEISADDSADVAAETKKIEEVEPNSITVEIQHKNTAITKKNTATATVEASETPPRKPMKSVFLLFDPSNNTVIPIEPSVLGLSHGKSVRTSSPAVKNVSNSSSAQNEISEDIDNELALELEELEKRGDPTELLDESTILEYECSVCHEQVVGYTEIVKHFHSHALEDNTCHICNKRFSSRSSLGVHYLTHTGMTFCCPVCKRALGKKQSLLEHIRFHNGEYRHTCNDCGRIFITSSSLSRHSKIHTGTEPSTSPVVITCTQCLRKFTDHTTFTNHMKAHKIINSHVSIAKKTTRSIVAMKCQFCGNMYGSPFSLSQHLKKVHDLGKIPLPLNYIPLKRNDGTTTQVILTEVPSSVKVIDVIEISDDDENSAPPAIQIETLPDGTMSIGELGGIRPSKSQSSEDSDGLTKEENPSPEKHLLDAMNSGKVIVYDNDVSGETVVVKIELAKGSATPGESPVVQTKEIVYELSSDDEDEK